MYLNIAWFPLDFNMCGENAVIIYSSSCSLHVNQNSKYNNGKCIQYKNFIYRSWYINIFSMNIVMYGLIFSWRYTVLVFILFWNDHINVERTNWLYILVHCTIYNTILLNCFSILTFKKWDSKLRLWKYHETNNSLKMPEQYKNRSSNEPI